MKQQISILLNILLLLALSACGIVPASPSHMPSPTTATQPSRLPDPDEVRALLVQLVDVEKRAPGIVVGMIADDPQERWVVGYGRLSATDDRIPDGDTVFEIGSITKVFTGILLAQAVLNGEVKLDDPISMVLPEGVTAPEYEGKSITLLDLATHTAGLPRWPSNNSPEVWNNPFANYTMDLMYDFLSGYRLTRAPGSMYEYSNYGFGLLGNLLVRVANQADYEALLLERIANPLGMESTRIELTPDMRSRLATPHSSYSAVTSLWDDPTLQGAGSIRSTANDMLTFLAANMGMTETELQPALQLAITPQRPGEILAYIGLGWNLPGSGDGIHYHGGGLFGSSSFLAWDSELKIGVVVLMNVYNGPKEYLGYHLLRGLPKPFPGDPQVLAVYAGRYQFDDFDVTVRVDGAHIYIGAPGSGEAELIAISENQFAVQEAYAEITFYLDDRGEVDRMEMVGIGGTLEAKKIP
jgi:serine-type D-Ala-D-Ala carboxypeptidase/endopeptidase